MCVGGGLHFVADADIVITASDAQFMDPHVSVGQVVAYEGIALARKSPMEPVLRMALMGRGERLSAQRAYQLGITSQIVDPPEKLRETVQELAEKIAHNSPAAMRATKLALWGALEHGLTDACKAGALHLAGLWGHPDQDEGPPRLRRKTPNPTASRNMSYETLIVERHGHVGWLINNRPDQLNAMSAMMRDEFADAWIELDRDPKVRVIVHTGNGRAFQTGVDVTEIATDGQGMQRYQDSVVNFDLHFTAWHQQVWKPVITAVNGICCGGGFHWVADADIVIAASDAQFFDPHVSIGQVVAIEAIGLIRKMPVEAVMRMAFMGKYERMNAQRAYELGMISQIVDPPEKLRERPRSWPRRSPATRRPPCAPQRRRYGPRSNTASPTPARSARNISPVCGVTPTRTKAPAPSPKSASLTGKKSNRRFWARIVGLWATFAAQNLLASYLFASSSSLGS